MIGHEILVVKSCNGYQSSCKQTLREEDVAAIGDIAMRHLRASLKTDAISESHTKLVNLKDIIS